MQNLIRDLKLWVEKKKEASTADSRFEVYKMDLLNVIKEFMIFHTKITRTICTNSDHIGWVYRHYHKARQYREPRISRIREIFYDLAENSTQKMPIEIGKQTD